MHVFETPGSVSLQLKLPSGRVLVTAVDEPRTTVAIVAVGRRGQEAADEVEVTMEAPLTAPLQWPAEWLNVESSGVVVRFTDTAWSDGTERRVRTLLPDVRSVLSRNLPLRSIFVALAKSTRRDKGAAA